MSAAVKRDLDVAKIRADFPILSRRVHGRPLVYLDNAATTQKPRQVIEAIANFYYEKYSNIHRGIHELSQEATAAHDDAREKVRAFLGAADRHEIVFTRGATEAINLVVWSWGWQNVGPGDAVLITALEHHANIVPWQMLCERKGARLVVAPIDDRGVLLLDEMEKRIDGRTRIIAATHVSNVMGTINPVGDIVAMGRRRGIPVLIDGAQAVSHMPVDVAALGCDFYAFSGHKMYGPSGIGALWGRRELLDAMPPWQGGGDMIDRVTYDKTTFNVVPYKFEAGTPDIAGAVGLGAAIDYLTALGREKIGAWEHELLAYATERMGRIPGLRIVGTAPGKSAVLSFVIDGTHPTDVATLLDQEGVAVRTGHHCAMPLMDRLGLPGTARASFGMYNTREEIDVLVEATKKAVKLLR